VKWKSKPIQDPPIRRRSGRIALCGIVLPALLVGTGCGSDPPGGAAAPREGAAASTLAKQRLEKLKGTSGVPPKGAGR
jgi:hypothetical protein